MDSSGRVLVVGVSSRALFDLEEENRIWEEQGTETYSAYQIAHENEILREGTAFSLVRALLGLNSLRPGERVTEVVVMSRNSADTSLRIFNSVRHYKLDITRAALTGGAPLSPYLGAFGTDLFLSANGEDVRCALRSGIAAGLICTSRPSDPGGGEDGRIRIAFDGDAVLFSDESDRIYREKGIAAFEEHESRNASLALPAGPFAKFLRLVSSLQKEFAGGVPPIRTALVTARGAPAHERVIRTLRAWDVGIDEAFFLGGTPKSEILRAFGAHIFFDDRADNAEAAPVPSARVPGGEE